ncbi:transmembrane protein 144-like isoform X1 [Mizuhopecten yessoensis]|uniref:transmembrane protein 144-like isoform X1 n=1 Tax=Mizuhopecten yessoensis TaxID=6573 RepID=UPI000B45B9C2|nr:transmembrane protein 144-like isoform X1 [Mizuhopecten yessoensis]XP_021364904.1 transmembrane protein 144-like isoform X1 [Mizuhopecten yessoensis]
MFSNTTTVSYNDTTLNPSTNDVIAPLWGYISAAVAVIFLGNIVVPVKRFETGDGIYFQLMFCHGALLVGTIIQQFRSEATFYPIVMLGGVVWITANLFLVPIVKAVGMAQGMCVWGICNMLSGWATGRFGLFGIQKEVPDSIPLNYSGVLFCILSAVIFSFLKPDIRKVKEPGETTPSSPSAGQYNTFDPINTLTSARIPTEECMLLSPANKRTEEGLIFVDKLPPTKKKILGITMSVISGALYGQTYTPSLYVQQTYNHSSQFGRMDYAFATMCGLFLGNTFYFCVYCVVMGNIPRIYPRASLPGILTGLMWGTASSLWFLVNDTLSESVSFPIMTTVPIVINAIVGVVFFREIKGRRNLCLLLLGIAVTGAGAVMCALSKHPV